MFANCINLENVTLTSLNFIPVNFVLNCTKLTSLNLPNAVSGNLFNAFANTPLLETLYTPQLNTLITNSYRAFYLSGVKNIDFSKINNLSILANDIFENTTRLLTLDIRSCTTSIGTDASVNNNVFRLIKTGVTIIANAAQQNINLGQPEPDLLNAISTRGATVIYV
nr:leucine-rich repeat protein [Flavobacterium sp. HSC-32F16]